MAGAVACSLALSPASVAWAQARPAAADKSAAGPTPAASATTAAAPAPAPKADLAAAKKHYGEGEKKFKAGDYAGAIPEFKEANDVKSTPQAERYLGLSEDALGHFPAAVDWYDKFLAHVPEKMTAQGDETRKRSAEIKAMPGKVHVDSTPPGALVTVDDKPSSTPMVTPADIDVAPGTHTIKLTATGHVAASKPVEVAFASSQSVTVALEAETVAAPPPPPAPVAEAPAPAAPPPPAEPRSKVPAFVTGGLAVAAAAVGTVFGIVALGDKSDYDKNPTSSKADSGDTHALIADMAFGVALTFGVTSAVLFLTKDELPAPAATGQNATPGQARADGLAKPEKSAISITPTPIVGPHTGGAGFVLRF